MNQLPQENCRRAFEDSCLEYFCFYISWSVLQSRLRPSILRHTPGIIEEHTTPEALNFLITCLLFSSAQIQILIGKIWKCITCKYMFRILSRTKTKLKPLAMNFIMLEICPQTLPNLSLRMLIKENVFPIPADDRWILKEVLSSEVSFQIWVHVCNGCLVSTRPRYRSGM